MYTWTPEHQRLWKERLKQIIKSSGQTQAEVARAMARQVSKLDGTNCVDTAFVAPLSRFVNAKGSEIHRWFELETERLTPLSIALKLDSPSLLIALRDEIIHGTNRIRRHPAFPQVQWSLDWIVNGRAVESNQALMATGSCVFTRSLLTAHCSQLDWMDDPLYTNVELPTWKRVRELISPTVESTLQARLQSLSSDFWHRCGFEFGTALDALGLLLRTDTLWNDAELTDNWVSLWIDAWVDLNFWQVLSKFLPNTMEASDDVLFGVFKERVLSGGDLQAFQDALVTQSSFVERRVPFNPGWIKALKIAKHRDKALSEMTDWYDGFGAVELVDALQRSGLMVIENQYCRVVRPRLWLPLVDVFAYEPSSSLWWSVLWWKIQAQQWDWVERLSTLRTWHRRWSVAFLWSELVESTLQVKANGVYLQRIHWDAAEVQAVWSQVLLSQYSGIGVPWTEHSEPGAQLRLHELSKLLAPCLAHHYSLHDVSSQARWPLPMLQGGYPLVYWAPFQSPPRTVQEWTQFQLQTSYPLWTVLEWYAQRGMQSAMLLLALGGGSFSPVWEAVPIRRRLFWLSKVSQASNRLYIFQALLIDYWKEHVPNSQSDLDFVLQIGRQIGFDTVITWMQGWLNPLFLAQHSDGYTLGNVALQFALYFDRPDLITQWSRMLWNWLRSPDALQQGFVQWNSRRVPIAEDAVANLFENVQSLLLLGLKHAPQIDLMRDAVIAGNSLISRATFDQQAHIVRQVVLVWKRQLLHLGDPLLLQSWIDSAPEIDLEVERAVLDAPELLTKLWRLDEESVRRSEILRLAGLLRPVPTWAIAFAQRQIQQHGHWPTWLSPHVPEASGLIPWMLQDSVGGHRLWWLKVYAQHVGVDASFWSEVQTWFESIGWKDAAVQMVHYLGPNQTPKVDLNDVLSWLLWVQRSHKTVAQSNRAAQFWGYLYTLWCEELDKLSSANVIALKTILTKQGYGTRLWDLELMDKHWNQLSDDVRRIWYDIWYGTLSDLNPTNLDHPVVGHWLLRVYIEQGHPDLAVLLLRQLCKGNFSGLSLLVQQPDFEGMLIQLLEESLRRPESTASFKTWLWQNPHLLRHDHTVWKEWLQRWLSSQFVDVVDE